MLYEVVFCLPFAGAGAGFFRAWPPVPDGGVEIVPLQLAGREERFIEEPATTVERAVQDLLAQVEAMKFPEGTGVSVFGHSMGAILAFELVRALHRRGTAQVTHLFVSGSPSPHSPRVEAATGTDDETFIARVRKFAGYEHPAFDDPDMRELLMPVLRADVELHEGYRADPDACVGIPVTALRGRDDQLVSCDDLEGWAAVTNESNPRELNGGHMYLADDPSELLTLFHDVLVQQPTHESASDA